MKRRTEILRWLALTGVLLAPGCVTHDTATGPLPTVCPNEVTKADVVLAAEEVLAGMQFTFEKLDAEAGLIRTRPHRAGQFFEFWQSDNVGGFNVAEANLQTIRRSVEVRVKEEDGRTCMDCNTRIERLSLPENEVASTAQAYRMHSGSEAMVQTFALTPQQRAGMAWVDLGEDPALAGEVLRRIEQRLECRGN